MAKRKGFKLIKRKWHSENKHIVWNFFNGVCQECMQPITGKWDIHHLKYQWKHGSVYEAPADKLIEGNIITLVCRPCHNKIHTADDPHNPQPLENQAPCENCGKGERGMIDRKKGEQLDKILCRSCYLNYKNGVTQLTLF